MPLLTVIIVLTVIGVIMYLVNSYVPMSAGIKNLLNIAVVVIVAIWLLKAFGLLDSLNAVTV